MPWRTVVLVGLGLVLFYAVDTAVTAWGPVYLSSDAVFTDPPTSPAMYALATLPYLVATLVARSVGRPATARFGAPDRRAGSARSTAFVGLAVVVFAPASVWQVAIVGFFVVGLGVAVIAPLVVLGGRPGRRARRAADPARAPGPGRRRRRPVQPVQLRRRPASGRCSPASSARARCGSGFAVPMVLVLGLLPLARHFATVGAPD